MDAEQLKLPTRPLYEDPLDPIIHDEKGTVYCNFPETHIIRKMHYNGFERDSGPLKFHCPMSDTGQVCAWRDACHRVGGISADVKRRIVRIKINVEKRRTFGEVQHHTRKWRGMYPKRNALERINARVAREIQIEEHFMRGFVHLRECIAFTVILGQALVTQRDATPIKMHSLVHVAAA